MAPFYDTILEMVAGTGPASRLRRTIWQREIDQCDKLQKQRAARSNRTNHWRVSHATDPINCSIAETKPGALLKQQSFEHTPMIVFKAPQTLPPPPAAPSQSPTPSPPPSPTPSPPPSYPFDRWRNPRKDSALGSSISDEDLEAARCTSTGYHRTALQFDSRLDPRLFPWRMSLSMPRDMVDPAATDVGDTKRARDVRIVDAKDAGIVIDSDSKEDGEILSRYSRPLPSVKKPKRAWKPRIVEPHQAENAIESDTEEE